MQAPQESLRVIRYWRRVSKASEHAGCVGRNSWSGGGCDLEGGRCGGRTYACYFGHSCVGWHGNLNLSSTTMSRNPVLTMKTVLVRPTSTSHNLAPTLSLTQDTAHGAYSSVILKTFLQPLLGLAYTTTKQTIPLLSIQSYWPQHAAELSTSSQIPRSVQPPLRKPLQYYRRSIPCRRPQSERLERFTLSRC
jgi:hypothetical protein